MTPYTLRLIAIHLKIAHLREGAALISRRLADDTDEFEQLAKANEMHELKWRIREESWQRRSERWWR